MRRTASLSSTPILFVSRQVTGRRSTSPRRPNIFSIFTRSTLSTALCLVTIRIIQIRPLVRVHSLQRFASATCLRLQRSPRRQALAEYPTPTPARPPALLHHDRTLEPVLPRAAMRAHGRFGRVLPYQPARLPYEEIPGSAMPKPMLGRRPPLHWKIFRSV